MIRFRGHELFLPSAPIVDLIRARAAQTLAAAASDLPNQVGRHGIVELGRQFDERFGTRDAARILQRIVAGQRCVSVYTADRICTVLGTHMALVDGPRVPYLTWTGSPRESALAYGEGASGSNAAAGPLPLAEAS